MSTSCHASYATFARLHRAGADQGQSLRSFAIGLGQNELGFDWASVLADESAVVYIASEGDVLSGAVVAWCDAARVTAELCWIGVAPSARRRGIGRLMLDHAADAMRERGAVDMMTDSDHPAVAALLLAAGARLRGRRILLPLARPGAGVGPLARSVNGYA